MKSKPNWKDKGEINEYKIGGRIIIKEKISWRGWIWGNRDDYALPKIVMLEYFDNLIHYG